MSPFFIQMFLSMYEKLNVFENKPPLVAIILISGSTDSSCLLSFVTSGKIAEVVVAKTKIILIVF